MIDPPRPADVTPAELNRLSALATSGRYRELEQSSRELLRGRPDSGALWKVLAVSLWMQDKEALGALERATTLLPHDAEVHSDFGTALLALGKLSVRRSVRTGGKRESLHGAAHQPAQLRRLLRATRLS